MTSSNSPSTEILSSALLVFSQQYIDNYKTIHHELPQTDVDDLWLSPCQQGEASNEKIYWQPTLIKKSLSFSNIESALELKINNDIVTYFSTLFSESLPALCSEGELSLLFAWNEDDFQRLQENIIGHVLMKRKLKQAITIFFAVTDEEDIILSVMNDTGEVWVEKVGCEPHKKLADSLPAFIKTLTPPA